MVRIVSVVPHKSVVKEVICRSCGATLEYVPSEVKSRYVRDYGGGGDTVKTIQCPNCVTEINVS